jgi:RimJ/RimL family protein N-acetyltransferase
MNNIGIRRYKESDVSEFFNAVIESKEEVSKWLPWCSDHYSIEDTIEWIKEIVPKRWKSKKWCDFVIVNLKSSKVLGGCSLEQIDLRMKEASIGYWVRTSETNKGIATFACNHLLDFGFTELRLHKIKVILSINNHSNTHPSPNSVAKF